MPETRDIVVVGGGFAGQGTAHYFMRHIYPKVKSMEPKFRLIIIDQSSHFWYNVGAPRAIVDAKRMPHDKTFVPMKKGFDQYGAAKDDIVFWQARPTALDVEKRYITIEKVNDDTDTLNWSKTIQFHCLIIATGTKTPTPLTSLHGNHTETIRALDDMNEQLKHAERVVIGGGGPVGVETAGEIGEMLNGWKVKREDRKVRITLVVGGPKMLQPVLSAKHSDKVRKDLEKVGVDVFPNAKVTSVEHDETGGKRTFVYLDAGRTEPLECDVYIPAYGVQPNTDFVPGRLLNAQGYVWTNPMTLRVDGAGPGIYCVGDAGSYTRGGILDILGAVKALGTSIGRDLGVKVKQKERKMKTPKTQVVPVGSKAGVGAFHGLTVPSFGVRRIKGRDYMLDKMEDTTEGKAYARP